MAEMTKKDGSPEPKVKKAKNVATNVRPDYRNVLFVDTTNGAQFLIPDTVQTKDRGIYEVDGQEYDMVRISISSAGHPLWTGKNKLLDTEGRLDKFAKKYQRQAERQQMDLAKKEEADKEKAKSTKKKK